MSTLDQTLEIRNSPDIFKKALWISILLHASLFLTVTVKNIFFNSEPLMYESAVRVDLVALPDKLPTQIPSSPPALEKSEPKEDHKEETKKIDPPKPTPKLVETKSKKTDDSINIDKVKKKESSAIKKLKQLAAFEKLNKITESEKRATEAGKRAERMSKLLKGNQLSSGSELKGMSLLHHDNYVASVKRHIYDNWSLPEWLAHKELKAQIIVKFDDHGNLLSKQLIKSSGNPSFDEAALNSIEKSSPVPVPPESLVKIIMTEGVLIGFPE